MKRCTALLLAGLVVVGASVQAQPAPRLVMLFVDDLHLDFRTTPRTRELLARLLKSVVRDGDLLGMVTTGTSSISLVPTADHSAATAALRRITGGSTRTEEILSATQGSRQLVELRHRAHVALSTAYDLVTSTAARAARAKTIVLISNGWDFNPAERSRIAEQVRGVPGTAQFRVFSAAGPAIQESDLVREFAVLTRTARAANARIHALDPRNLFAGPGVTPPATPAADDLLADQRDSLRAIASETGGAAVIDMADLDPVLQRVAAEP